MTPQTLARSQIKSLASILAAMESSSGSMSLRELKTNLKDAMKKSGALCAVKAQLRHDFIKNLTEGSLGKKKSSNSFGSGNLRDRVMLSVLYNALRTRGMNHSCSVFVAESGMDKNSTFTPTDILESLNFGLASQLYKIVENDAKSGKVSNVFDLLIDECCTKLQRSSAETSMQTETSGRTARQLLDMENSALKSKYSAIIDLENKSPQASIQERMLQFQQECDERMKKDLEGQIRHFRDTEMLKIRLDESRKARTELDAQRRELELEFQRRLTAASDREKELTRQHAEKERQLEATQYEYRQRMQRELDELRLREVAAAKKSELDAQGAALLEQRLRETQIRIEAQKRELGVRESELDVRARTDADRAKQEAMSSIRAQMELVARERAQLKDEREALEDSIREHKDLVNSAKELKTALRDARQLVGTREDELDVCKRQVQRLEAQYRDDETEYAALAAATGGLTRPQHLLKLVRTNAEMQAKVAVQATTIDELESERNRLEAADALLKRRDAELAQSLDEAARARMRHAEEVRDLNLEMEGLKRALRVEKTRVMAGKNRVDELERLLQEQRTLAARLGRLQPGPSGRLVSGSGLLHAPGQAAARLRKSLDMEDIESIFKIAAKKAATVTTTASAESAAMEPPVVAPPLAQSAPAVTVTIADISEMVDSRLRTSLQSFGRSSADSLPPYTPSSTTSTTIQHPVSVSEGAEAPTTSSPPTSSAVVVDDDLARRRAQAVAETARIEAELEEQRRALERNTTRLARERAEMAAAAAEAEAAVSPSPSPSPSRTVPSANATSNVVDNASVRAESERRAAVEAEAVAVAERERTQGLVEEKERQVREERERERTQAAAAADAKAEAEAEAAAAAKASGDREASDKAEADKAAVAEARAKVLARRRQRAARDGGASSSPAPAPVSDPSNTSRRLSGQDETHDFESNSFEDTADGGAWF